MSVAASREHLEILIALEKRGKVDTLIGILATVLGVGALVFALLAFIDSRWVKDKLQQIGTQAELIRDETHEIHGDTSDLKQTASRMFANKPF